jgi:hypothetical protein
MRGQMGSPKGGEGGGLGARIGEGKMMVLGKPAPKYMGQPLPSDIRVLPL